MSFKKTVENFTCEHCGTEVIGNGYTNHCPKCLYSKHVDIDPGDRAASCGGMMVPTAIEGSTGSGYTVLQKCRSCGHERRNAIRPEDDVEAILALVRAKK
jgi:hypothetical protein